MSIIYIDGQYCKADTKAMEAFTPGVIKAKGVFETMLGLDGMALDIALHMKRLRQGLKVLKIAPPRIDRLIFNKVLTYNKLSSARLRLIVWQAGKKAHVMVGAVPYKEPDKKIYRVCCIKTSRTAHDRLANVKSLDYAMFLECYRYARAKGYDEALLLNRNGHIFEASRANIFWMKNKVLFTPPLSSGCLNGITRQQIIQHARRFKILLKTRNLTPEILKDADAAFLTNSLIGIKPIEIKEIKIASQ
jgi:branched-subunit amino acid aminotransferase/4-amino-4-deoxychorismate lyase